MKHFLLLICLSLILLIHGGSIDNRIISDEDDELDECESSILESSTIYIQKYVGAMFLPKHAEDPESKFLFYSYRDPTTAQYVTNSNFSDWDIESSGFDAMVDSVFIVHGFRDLGCFWTKKAKDAFMKRDKYNVFILEWGQTSSSFKEEMVIFSRVGQELAMFIQSLKISKNIDLQNVYLIGHSMGAHIVGIAGKIIKQKLKSSVGRITGLDPAGPNFYKRKITELLQPSDASFVDVIHTNIACSRMKGWGLPYVNGHFNFYPNGGYLQPGCKEMSSYLFEANATLTKINRKFFFGTINPKEKDTFDKHMACSHARAYDLFIASINNDGCEFLSVKCSSWKKYLSGQCDDHNTVVMGYQADSYKKLVKESTQTKFFLNTTDSLPYCVN